MTPFSLIPSVSLSEKTFLETIPIEQWNLIKHSIYTKQPDYCFGCSYTPENKKHLQIHLHVENTNNPELSEFLLLCEGCHSIKHFDITAKNNWCVLVNSVYSQEELMLKNRHNGLIRKDIMNNKIILIKKTPDEYLAEIIESRVNINLKTKILFGNKFSWHK
jgi:hypothetical protein